MILAALPAFLVPDVAASVAYYRDVLGFHEALVSPGFGIVDVAPGQGIHFGADGGKLGRANRRDGGAARDAILRLALVDFERVLAGLTARGAKLAGPPRDQPWGLREVEVEDRDGHVLCVAGGAFPEGRALIVPELVVDDLAASVAHYVSALGFGAVAPWGDAATVAAVEREGARISLRQADGKVRPRSNCAAQPTLWDVCVECAGLDALVEELRGRGAVILRGPETAESGMRELEVVDLDGYVLCFSEDQHPEPDEDIGKLRSDPAVAPENTAVRVALWRALHVEVDAPPHVIEDVIGLQLAAPDEDWRSRPDMNPAWTRLFRASIVARARFVEDLVVERAEVTQYVILGAGLDTFAQRRPERASRLTIFEVDQPGPQAWKRQRLLALGLGVPPFLRLVPVDFEAGGSWLERLAASGFDAARPAIVASTGVSMYLTKDAVAATLRQVATLAPGSTFVMTFMLPFELQGAEVRPGLERAAEGARKSGTPFISFFTPAEMLDLARAAGFRDAQHVSADALADRYFAGRADGLRPPSNGEEILVAVN